MVKYTLKRVGMALITLLLIVFLLFVLVRIMPGNPFPSERMSTEQIAAKRAEMGLDDPILTQFGRYMANLLRGDFGKGTSLYNGAPIKTVLSTAISNSFRIGGLAILTGTAVGLLLGIVAALNRGKFLDGFCTVFSIIGVCVPSYVFLIFLQYFFSFKIPFFPYFFDANRFLFSSVLPSLSLSLFTMSTVARFTRNEMVEVMDSDYVRLAESKGLYGSTLVNRHVLRNALVPIVTVLAPLIVDLLTGALVVEKIYGINGIGKLMVDAIAGEGVDYNYVLALGILYSALYIGIMLVVDLLYGLLDPRIRVSAKGGQIMNQTPYVPAKGDFQFLSNRDIATDQNFASQGYWKGVAISFFRNKRAMVGLVIVVLIIFFACFGPMMNSYGYKDIVSVTTEEGKQIVARGIGPQIPGLISGGGNTELFGDQTFLFGTDEMGRDLWTRTWQGARISLIIAFVTIVIDMIIGMSYGLISGFFGGLTDNIMQRIVEIGNSVPRLVIVSVLAIFMPKGMGLVIVALLLTEWIGMSKISRAEMLKLKEQEYVLASRTLGAGSFHIIFKEILPNTIGPIITQVMFSIPTAIFTEAFLSFVGVGIVLPQCSIGSLIEDGFNNITTLPYQILPPIAVLALLMLGFNFIGDGFREALAPKLEDM